MRKTLISLSLISIFLISGCAYDPNLKRDKLAKRDATRHRVYIVNRGDSLSKISKKYDVELDALKKRNGLKSNKIIVGQRLYIPSNSFNEQYKSDKPAPQKGSKKGKSGRKKVAGNQGEKYVPPTKAPNIDIRLAWPVENPNITSSFGVRKSGKHDGIDIAAPRGTKIYAAADGIVLFSGWGPTGYGLTVLVKHSENIFTVYSHNDKNIARKDQKVKKGDVIATVGKTGRATGEHVHFEVRVNRVAYDPLAYLPKLGK